MECCIAGAVVFAMVLIWFIAAVSHHPRDDTIDRADRGVNPDVDDMVLHDMVNDEDEFDVGR